MTPRDSGEREVCGAGMRDARCRKLKYHDGAHDFDAREVQLICMGCGEPFVFHPRPECVGVSLSLAQRILAALETPSIFGSDHRVDLARELRAIVERKP